MDEERWPAEWLRGVLELCVLAVVAEGETYGYAVISRLREAGLGTVKGGTLYPVAHSVNLRGFTRDSVVKLAEHLGIPVAPTMATRDELYIADEVFMTGTAAEVSPVSAIDRRPIGTGRAGETTMRLRELYLQAAAGEVPEFAHWLTYVDGPGAG